MSPDLLQSEVHILLCLDTLLTQAALPREGHPLSGGEGILATEMKRHLRTIS